MRELYVLVDPLLLQADRFASRGSWVRFPSAPLRFPSALTATTFAVHPNHMGYRTTCGVVIHPNQMGWRDDGEIRTTNPNRLGYRTTCGVVIHPNQIGWRRQTGQRRSAMAAAARAAPSCSTGR
jgi:hypothetical protein